MGNSQSKCC